MLLLKNVSKQYKNGVNALYNINLEVKQGEFIYVIGPTGSGKSTLIKILDGREKPSKGQAVVGNFDVGKLRHAKVPIYRRHIGVVFQDFKLLDAKTVFENVAFALEVVNTPKHQTRKRVREVLRLVDLSEKANAYPRELSGGQQQRVAIARAIANKPGLLIADEPTGNLDPEKSKEIIELLDRINHEEETTIIMVTHDVGLVNKYKKRTIALEEGHIVADLSSGGYITHE